MCEVPVPRTRGVKPYPPPQNICKWLGPSLGGQNLVFSHVSDQTRLEVPIHAAASVHGMPLMAGWIELGELYPTSHERQAMDGRCGVEWCSETRLVRNVRKDQIYGT